ncbi:MAG: hypothetical protein R3Y53_09385 [Bacillota bacterium]
MNIQFGSTRSPFARATQTNTQQTTKQKASENEAPTAKQVETQIYQNFANDYAKNQQESAELQALTAKMKNGEQLTPEEEQYMKSKNPEMYKEAEEIAKESKQYQNALDQAETKEDVDKVKVETLAKYASELKSVENNPYIPDGKKLEIAEKINEQLNVVAKNHTEFVSSEAFDKLPHEANVDETTSATATAENETIAPDEEAVKEQIHHIKKSVVDKNKNIVPMGDGRVNAKA